MAAVAVELGGPQLENTAARIDFGEQQPCAAVGGKRFGFGRGCLKTETEYVRSAHTLLQD